MITGIHSSIFSNAVLTDDTDVLNDIHQSNKNIAILRRTIPDLKEDILQLLHQDIEIRASGSLEEIVEHLANSSILKETIPIYKDILNVLKLFQTIIPCSSYRLFIGTVSSNMCRKFHTDINSLRLLCTYSGPGTLWVPEDYLDRKQLTAKSSNEDIVTDPAFIQQVDTGHIAILKGAVYPKEGTKAIVHRSPTIEESGQKRLLLRIDTNAIFDF